MWHREGCYLNQVLWACALVLIDPSTCISLTALDYDFADSIDAMLENIHKENEISPSLNEIVKMMVDPYRAATVVEDAARQSSDSYKDEEIISPWQDGHAGEDDDSFADDVFNHVGPNEDQEVNYTGGGFDGMDDDFGMDPMPEPNPDTEDEEASASLPFQSSRIGSHYYHLWFTTSSFHIGQESDQPSFRTWFDYYLDF